MTNEVRKTILNAGSGSPLSGRPPEMFSGEAWEETRLDIIPANQPDIVSSIVDMRGAVADATFDVVYSSHAVEHIYAHDVIPAFREFRRVLKPGGFALVTCPNLVAISRFILAQDAEAVAYESAAGPIRPIDMLYGHCESIAKGAFAMAHRTGFTPARLGRIGVVSGFSQVRVIEGGNFDIWGLLLTQETALDALESLFAGSRLELFFQPGHAASDPANEQPEPAQP
jgi:SAM-dependent methyltransferase